MSNELFMRHHYGASGYVDLTKLKASSEYVAERSEIMAELFRASTGFLAPGKDVSVSNLYSFTPTGTWEKEQDSHEKL